MLFARDPAKAVAKARRLLSEGDPLAALRLARKTQERARPPVSGELGELIEQARRRVVEEATARAEKSASEGLLEDAAEWLRGALDHAPEGEEREELRRRLEALEAGPGEAAPVAFDFGSTGSEPPAAGGVSSPAAGAVTADPEMVDHLYEIYVGTLRPDLRPYYEERPADFRRAVVALNEGEVSDDAADALLALAAAEPEDAVLRLERGRLHVARQQLEPALADLAAAADELGDEPLDGSTWELSLAALWSATALERGDHAGVLARLESLGEVTLRSAYLTSLYADALIASGETEDAVGFLRESVAAFPGDNDLALRLARMEHGRGNAEAAIAALEGGLARACAAGGCSQPALEPGYLQALLALYLERGGPLDRAEELLRMLRAALGDRLRAADWVLVARYHELRGEPDDAAVARSHAERLVAAAGAAMPAPPGDEAAGNEAPRGEAPGTEAEKTRA